MGISEKSLAAGEHKILTLRTHPKEILGPTLLTLLIIIGAIVGATFVPESDNRKWIWLIIAVVVALATLVVFLLPFLRWRTTTYTITNRRLVSRKGILTRTGRDIPLYRINDISFDKDLVDRIFGCGTLEIHDASNQEGLILHDIPKVEKVQVMLQELLHAKDDGTDEGDPVPNEPRRPRRSYEA